MIYVILKAGISSFLASLGFGFLFNIKGRKKDILSDIIFRFAFFCVNIF